MEKFIAIYKLGARYLYRYKRRYGFLLAALIFGFAIVTFITSLKAGMYESVYYTAQSHYAGDIVAEGFQNNPDFRRQYRLEPKEISAILDAAGSTGINPKHTVMRTLYSAQNFVHYNGAAIELKYLIGCDWESEAHLFSKMTFEQPPESLSGDDGIILSVPTAQKLGAHKGDMVTLELETSHGQKNTGQFVVKGIVQDTSIFGYFKAYVPRVSLNRLIGYNDDDCSSVGFFLADPASAEQKRKLLQNALTNKIDMGPLVYNREEFSNERQKRTETTKVFLYTMSVYLSEIADLLNAMDIVTYFLYVMMLLIILVSAAVTYRLILHERVKEMGTMRAIGFYGADLRMVLWTEITILGFIALAAGFILALVLNWAVSLLSFSWFPSFEIFMTNGKLKAMYLPGTMLINAVSIFLILFVMALFPALRISKKKLPELLSGDAL